MRPYFIEALVDGVGSVFALERDCPKLVKSRDSLCQSTMSIKIIFKHNVFIADL